MSFSQIRPQPKRIEKFVETMGTADYARAFYRKHGYDEEARIREFYDKNADKVVFCKVLAKR